MPNKTYFIGKVTCHENFEARADTIIYDICLIQLTEKIEFNTNVMPVCLPEHDFAPPPGKIEIMIYSYSQPKLPILC